MPRSLTTALLGFLLLCGALVGALGFAAAQPAPTLEAGLAVVDLTPEALGPLGGYAERRGQPAVGVHDRIEARALVLRSPTQSVALVALDLVGVGRDVLDVVRRRVADLSLDDVVLVATHTHAGPGGLTTVPLWRPAMGGIDRETYLRSAARIEGAVRRAHADLAPARVHAGRSTADRLADLVRNRADPQGDVDGSVGVLRIDRPDGTPRAVLVHFAAHPTLLGPETRELSAGWPGATRRALEEALPGVTALVLNGALGDVAPVPPPGSPSEPFARVEAYGTEVARAALEVHRAVATTGLDAEAPLEVRGTRIAWGRTVAGALLGGQPDGALAPRRSWPLPVARVEVAGVTLLTVPGEPTQATARRMGQGTRRWIVACGQDHLGYFADRETFRRGGYESDLSLFGPGAADLLAAAAAGELPLPPWPTTPVPAGPIPLRPAPTDAALPAGRALGRAHGRALAPWIHSLLRAAEVRIEDEVLGRGGGLLLTPGWLATGVAPRQLLLPLLVLHARRLQPHIPPEYLEEMEGIAESAGVPFDSILLENVFLTLAEQPDKAALLRLPARCTNVVALGEATSMGQVLHGSTLDWGMGDVLKERVVTLVLEPETGHPFVSVTWPGMVGTLRAMGAQGLSITEESCAAPEDTTTEGVPINLLLREIVQHAESLDQAVDRLTAAPGTCGYKVTVADARALDARVVELTAHRRQVRRPVAGLLYGVDPEASPEAFVGEPDPAIPTSDGSSRRRYPQVRALLEAQAPHVRLADLQEALGQTAGGVLNANTLLACVFEPQLGRFHVASVGGVDAAAGRLVFQTHELAAYLSPAARRRATPPWPVLDEGPVDARTKLENLAGIRVEEVVFRSPIHTGVVQNDTFACELFLPPDPAGVVIQLPQWKESAGPQSQRLIALALARQGLAVLLLPLPWQYGRASPGVRSGVWTLSENLARTREAAFQGAADAARASLWLERARGFEPGRQAIAGVSLGGHVASLALGAYPDRFAAGVFLLAGSHREGGLFRENGVTDGITRRLRDRGVGPEEARDLLGPIDAAALARPERADRVLLIAGDADPVVPRESAVTLAEAWGGAPIRWYPGGHYEVVLRAPGILKAMAEFLRPRLGVR